MGEGAAEQLTESHPRVVSLIPSGTEILFALGITPLAVSHECDFPLGTKELPRGTFSHVDSSAASGSIDNQVRALLESGSALYGLCSDLIAALRPAVIVTQAQCDVCAVRYADVADLVASRPELRETQIVSLNPASLAEVFEDTLRIGILVGKRRAAEAVIEGWKSRVEVVRNRTAEIASNKRPRVVVIEWTEPLMTAGNWTPELVAWAGGTNCLSEAGEHSGYVAWAAIREADPEVLVVAPCGFDLSRSLVEAEALKRLPGWCDLTAVKRSQAFALDGNQFLNRSGPRLVETLEILAYLIQPIRSAPPAYSESTVRIG